MVKVNCLTEWFYDEALEQAKKLDEGLQRKGRVQGVLHGVPLGLKVRKIPEYIYHQAYLILDRTFTELKATLPHWRL